MPGLSSAALRTAEFRRILLIKFSALGDVVHSIPVVNKLRRRYPTAEIDWLLRPAFAELIAHHEARCDLILHACRTAPRSAAELVPFVFTRKLDPHQMGFAFSEVLAHVNYMLRLGMLTEVAGADGIRRVTAAAVQ